MNSQTSKQPAESPADVVKPQTNPNNDLTAQKLLDLLPSNLEAVTRGYPTSERVQTKHGWKCKRIYRTDKVAITLKDVRQHLAGRIELVGIPILPDGTCWWVAGDVDNDETSPETIQARIAEYKLPILLTKSKSGWPHLYVVFDQPRPAYLARRLMKKWMTLLGFREFEIFPKQDTLGNLTKYGNGIAWPFFARPQDFLAWTPLKYSEPPELWDLPDESPPVVKTEHSDDPGYWDTRALEAMLFAFKKQIPGFAFHKSRKGYAVLCPGQTDLGWPDGNRHSTEKSHADWESEIWIENGWLAFRCFHAHCSEPKKTFSDWLDFWDPLRRRFNFDQWQAAETSRAEQQFLAEYGGAS